MNEEMCFLRAVFQQPDDDTVRLVYADWLEERNDPRARYLRLEVKHHRLEKDARDRNTALTKYWSDLGPKIDTRWVMRMMRTRGLSPGVQLDLTVVNGGRDLIEVRGGQEETALLVEGKSVALNWDDCQGSVGQYLVFTGHTRGADYARQLAEFVEGEVDGSRPLADQIGPLLAVFASGTYCLAYTLSAATESMTTLEYSEQSSANRELVQYYPADLRHLVCTQTRESLDEKRVAYFRKQIRAGRRPTVLTVAAEGAWCEFVIDGHHKLAAYSLARVKPTILSIVRWQAPEISLNEGLGWLPRGHPGVSEYRRVKKYLGR
jgi:uncharacterized protein (TIGR02996 family)